MTTTMPAATEAPTLVKFLRQPTARDAPTDYSPKLISMSDVVETKVEWLWQDRVALGKLTLLVGAPGKGKTFVAMAIAATVSCGHLMPDGTCGTLGDVIILNAEDDPSDTLKPRLMAHGADPSRVSVLSVAKALDKDGKSVERAITLTDIEILEKALLAKPDTKLLIVDPIGSFLGSGIDAYRDNEVRSVLNPLNNLAAKYKVAVLIVAHTRKSTADSADDAVLGSRAFTGLPRLVWHVIEDAEDPERRLFLIGKTNNGKPIGGMAFRLAGEPCRVVWERGSVDTTANEAMAAHARVAAARRQPGRTGPQGQRLDAATQWLKEYLGNESKPASEVMNAGVLAGHSHRTLQRARSELGVQSVRDKFGGEAIWRPWRPEDETSLARVESCELGADEKIEQKPLDFTVTPSLDQLAPIGAESQLGATGLTADTSAGSKQSAKSKGKRNAKGGVK